MALTFLSLKAGAYARCCFRHSSPFAVKIPGCGIRCVRVGYCCRRVSRAQGGRNQECLGSDPG
eukprot:2088789-Rhodomonas_salina.1